MCKVAQLSDRVTFLNYTQWSFGVQNDVVLTSLRRDDVALTSIRRHFNVMCSLGTVLYLMILGCICLH